MRILLSFLLVLVVSACRHPLAIIGEGDIVDLNGSAYGCTLDQFNASDIACTGYDFTEDYIVNYEAVPQPGWTFVRWEGPCKKESIAPNCSLDAPLNISQAMDTLFPGVLMPATTAVFEQVLVVGGVSGNTATLNAVAEFSVQLPREPTADVVVPVSSSDEVEGIPEQPSLTFTAANWDQPQIVSVRGQVESSGKDYKLVLGAISSGDSSYDGLSTMVPISGLALDVAPPAPLDDVIAQVEARLQPVTVYTGVNQLSFSLENSPAGMTIDLNTGLVHWTPAEDLEGQSFPVTVKVNDGALFDQVTFNVKVADLTPIASTVSDDTLTVGDGGTNLNGLAITAGDTGTGNITELALDLVPAGSVPSLPAWITPLTDAFFVTSNFDQTVELKIPLPDLPEGTDLSDVNLFGFVQPEDVEEQIWSSVLVNTSYEGTLESPVVSISLENLNGMYLFGVKQVDSGAGAQALGGRFRGLESSAVSSTAVEDVTCIPRQKPLGQGDNFKEQDCTVSTNAAIKIFVKDFGTAADSTRWNGTTIETLVDWLVSAQGGFDDLGLGYDDEFNVVVEPMNYLGYVTTGNGENRRTLHITDANYAQSIIQGTAVHEYFHHAQGKSPLPNQGLLINSDSRRSWLIEGTSRWFEDKLFDSINTYVAKEGGQGSRILQPGLNAVGSSGALRPYQRFSFFKLLASNCSSFDSGFNNLLNVDLATDPGGIASLVAELGNANCDFGDHLGASRAASLEAAMVFYQYATMSENRMSLLDSNESDGVFNFLGTNLQFNQTFYPTLAEWLALPDTSIHQLNNLGFIPPAGAVSFKIPAISGTLPAGSVAEMLVNASQEMLVSVTSKDPQFNGSTTLDGQTHHWFSTNTASSYAYDANSTIPELFVTLVNPSLTTGVTADVTFKVRGELGGDPIIVDPAANAEINQRVTQVVGVIPAADRPSVNRVVITGNGISGETIMNGDGSFFANVVVGLGSNTIRVQGYNGDIPVTSEVVSNFTGVAVVDPLPNVRNQLLASRAVFVLRWDTGNIVEAIDNTDLDIYSTDKNGGPTNLDGVIFWSSPTVGPGNLDFDQVWGFGPEVISYRAVEDDVYVNGTFNIDVHYYSGESATNYTIDVILNETEGANRRFLQFVSIVPHTVASKLGAGRNIIDPSRFDDLLVISCSAERVCSLSGFDDEKLAEAGTASGDTPPPAAIPAPPPSVRSRPANALEACQRQRNAVLSKYRTVSWQCAENGARL